MHAPCLGFFKVKPTGNRGPKTRQAIEDFIIFLNEVRCQNINPMLGLSEAYIRKELYREYLNLRRSEIELPGSAFRTVAGYPYVGCCAFNRYQSDGNLHDENRRVVFSILQENPNFPVTFPCRSGSAGPCENECKKPGDRAIQGFGCRFYDEMVKQEKVGSATGHGEIYTSTAIPWLIIAEDEAKRWRGALEAEISKTINYHKEVGLALSDLSGTDHAWCASFVNYCIKQSGFDMSAPQCRARSFLTDSNFVKIEKPVFGAIAVIANHHVCLVYAKDHKTERPIFLGGNQSDQINFAMFVEKVTYLLPKRFDASKYEIPELALSSVEELNTKFGIPTHQKSGENTR